MKKNKTSQTWKSKWDKFKPYLKKHFANFKSFTAWCGYNDLKPSDSVQKIVTRRYNKEKGNWIKLWRKHAWIKNYFPNKQSFASWAGYEFKNSYGANYVGERELKKKISQYINGKKRGEKNKPGESHENNEL